MSAACKRDFIICLEQEGAVSVLTSSLPGERFLLLYLFLSLTLLPSSSRKKHCEDPVWWEKTFEEKMRNSSEEKDPLSMQLCLGCLLLLDFIS